MKKGNYHIIFVCSLSSLLLLPNMAVGSKNNIPSIKCRNCEQKFGTCDYGECEGQSCVTIEVSHAQTRMVVKKTCSREIRSKSECLVTYPDGIESIQCYCTYDFCNSDGELAKIGLGQRKWLPEYLTSGRQRQKSKNINHKDYIRTNSQRGAARRYSNGSSYSKLDPAYNNIIRMFLMVIPFLLVT